jgi:CubicO group peptidase (beta-lactamase class C family)
MIVPERLAKFEERVAREIDNGLVPACQWAFGLDGEIVAAGVLGDADEDTRFTIFSATKALVASTVWTCIGEGAIKLDARVADMIPEFATNGKEDITMPASPSGRRTGSRGRVTSTTPPPRTGCWPS